MRARLAFSPEAAIRVFDRAQVTLVWLAVLFFVLPEPAVRGLVIAVLIGLTLATLMSQARSVERAVWPFMISLQAIPILAMVPVIKVSSRTALAERWPDLIDLDAGRVATGQATLDQVGWELFRMMLDVASGRRKTWADHWGLHNALAPFNPGPVT